MKVKFKKNELDFVYKAPAVNRLKYFLKNTADCGKVWYEIRDNLIKCWPFEEFALMSNAENAKAVLLKEFYDMLKVKQNDDFTVAVFPNDKDFFEIGIYQFMVLAKDEIEYSGRALAKKLPGDELEFYKICKELNIVL